MSEDLWETIDWGDDVVSDTSTHPSSNASPAFFDRKDTAATARLSGSSARSEECEKPSDHPTTITFPERKQHGQNRKNRSSWFDADLTKLVPLEDEKGGYRSGRSQCKASSTRAEDGHRRRVGRRQSDYVLEKRRVLEKHASLEERPVTRSFTKRFLSSVGLGKSSEAAPVSSDDDELDVPFPNIRRKSCY